MIADAFPSSAPKLIRRATTPLPKNWGGLPGAEGLVCSGDVTVTRGSSLRAKILVFKNSPAMRRFWRLGISRPPLTRDILAVTSDLSSIAEFTRPKVGARRPPELRVDPRYFCAVGFTLDNLSVGVITHESIHAAIAYLRRVDYKKWPDSHDSEECICYPAGHIASGISKILSDNGISL